MTVAKKRLFYHITIIIFIQKKINNYQSHILN